MPSISLIIPGLNEAELLPETLERIGTSPSHEIIYVDGGSRDQSCQIAAAAGANVCHSMPGRAKQLNLGGDRAKGQILLFLHADSWLPPAYAETIMATLQQNSVVAGAFALRFQPSSLSLRIIETCTNLRSNLFQLPFGDQGLFLRRETFKQVKGFRDLALLEDLDIVKRLQKIGKIKTTKDPILTSSRKWQKAGVFSNSLRNQFILLAWKAGYSEEQLAKIYYS